VTFVYAINVNNNKVVFFADDHVLIKLLRKKKVYDAKQLTAEFPNNKCTLTGLIKWWLNTGHFSF